MPEKVSLNEIIEQIRLWQLETNNFRNDSWTQEAYQDKLKVLYEELAPIVNNIDTNSRMQHPTQEEKS